MKPRRLLIAFLMPLIFAPTIFAQDFWMLKSYRRWTKEEIVRLISDSPWAQVMGDSLKTPIDQKGYVTVRLRSAVPIRQALVRMKQIEAGYDKFDAAQKAEFDAKMKGTLDCPACQENYVVTISPPVTDRAVRSSVPVLSQIRLEQLKDTVYLLNDKGEKRQLVFFQPPLANDGEATLFFPRLDEKGAKFLDGQSKTFSLIFEVKGREVPIPQTTRFDVTRMMIDGQVDF